MNGIRRHANGEAHITFGAACDEGLGDRLRVTVIAIGLSPQCLAQRPHRRGQGGRTGPQRHGRDRDPGVSAATGGPSGEVGKQDRGAAAP